MRKSQRGVALMEVIVTMAIVGIMSLATMNIFSVTLGTARLNQDKQFATQKAMSMLEELKSLVQVNSGSNIVVLDSYDDGTAFLNRLTTLGSKTTDPPDDPVSGNTLQNATNGQWLYQRQISVAPLTDSQNASVIIGSSDVRLVRVRVYKNDLKKGRILLAEVASVVRTLAVAFPTTQVYDVYCVATESVPGWWVNMSSLIPFVQNAINDLETRHPGLEFRQHWITHVAFGRDRQYVPYVNATTDDVQPINYVYFYPGLLPNTYVPEAGGSPVVPPAPYYYPPANFASTIRTEAGVVNASGTLNPFSYPVADQYNHAMRFYDEQALYRSRKAAMVTIPVGGGGTVTQLAYPDEEMTYRLLLDDMIMNPRNYLNALVINLHGELLPFPPVRNYSDAAKKPDYYHGNPASSNNGVRVVTHPEKLTYGVTNNAADTVRLRVYSYLTNPDSLIAKGIGSTSNLVDALPNRQILPEPITIVLRGLQWTPAQSATDFVGAISGGVNMSGSATNPTIDSYAFGNAPTSDLAMPQRRMYYTVTINPAVAPATVGDTVIKLFNSPLVSPCANPTCSTGGLAPHRRLYGMEYIPAPLEDFTTGSAVGPFQSANDLQNTNDVEKNTARWVLSIPPSVFAAQPVSVNNRSFKIETRIGDYNPTTDSYSLTYGPAYTDPPNYSVTYVWRGTNTWLYGAANSAPNLPPSERFQFLGDPRHCPYADLKMPHSNNIVGGVPTWTTDAEDTVGGVNLIGAGYNIYHDDFENATDGNKMSAEWSGTIPGPYNVTASNNKFCIKINGGATVTTTLTTGAAVTAAQVVSQLNNVLNVGFTSIAIADVVSGRVRITSKNAVNPGSSIQFDTSIANHCGALMGFDNAVHTTRSWVGWKYTLGGTQYGIKNDNTYSISPNTVDNDGWTTSNGMIEFDVMRAFQMTRTALMGSNSLFTTMTGWPYYYMGIGNEIGSDGANGFPDNVPVSRRPFTGTDVAQYFEQAITPGKDWGDTPFTGNPGTPPPVPPTVAQTTRSGVKLIQEADGSWFGIPSLGELYPDKMYNIGGGATDWKVFGNLPTPTPAAPTAAGRYLRIRRDALVSNTTGNIDHTYGTSLAPAARRTHGQGMPTFFWTGGANGVEADSGASTGTLTGAPGGIEIRNTYNITMDDPISATRPFQIAAGLPAIDDWGETHYGNLTTATVQSTFYKSVEEGTEFASALIAARDQVAPLNCMFVSESGLSPSGTAGTDFIARWSFLTLIQGFFEAGRFNNYAAPATNPVPRVVITAPDPNTNLNFSGTAATVTVSWSALWQRWDGRPYTGSYPANYAPSPVPTITYVLMYSSDNGLTWKYLDNNTTATPNTRAVTGDPHTTNSTTYAWNINKTLQPDGAYTIRVEAYRDAFQLHYSYHQYQAFISWN